MRNYKRIPLIAAITATLALSSTSYASIAGITVAKAQSCEQQAHQLMAQEALVLKQQIHDNTEYLDGPITSTISYPFGESDGSGAHQVVFGKGADNKFYIWVAMGSSCGCYSNMAMVGELRAGITPVTASADLTTQSLYMATALCPNTISTANSKYTLAASTNIIKCINATGTDHYTKTTRNDNPDIKSLVSAASATSLCTSAAATDIAQ